MRKKKGFTLIELLAVIVILAIIALIATPIILNVIAEARKGSFKDSAYGILRAAELGYTQDVLKGTTEEITYTYTNGAESSSISGKSLQYKGEKPQNGTVIINPEGEVALAIHDGNYCAEKGYNDTAVTISNKKVADCTISGGAPTPTPILNADTSGASVPELTTGMIPVKWNGTNWTKADINNEVGANQWYDYDGKMWANAVTVTSANRSTYENAAVGTTIPMSDINTMWVWVPRYKYAIPSGTGAREINIVFEASDAVKSSGTAVDTDYLTHPAFTFGATEESGIWVGKFETTGDITSPTILPNTASVRNQTVSAMYNASRKLENNATYGTSTDSDIHMMKNTEWGATVYLSHSKYGINAEMYKNNSSNYITGRSGGAVGGSQITFGSLGMGFNEYRDTGFYTYDGKCATTTAIVSGIASECSVVGNDLTDKTLAYNVSTTGNIYGIYDMSGGAWEYTMSMYRPNDTTSVTDESGFGATTSDGTMPSSDYWNRYTTIDTTTACNAGNCYGSALTETSSWYNDVASFVTSSIPWSLRGGGYANKEDAGGMAYYSNTGRVLDNFSFRIVQMKP